MTSLDTTLLVIITVLLSIFLLLGIALLSALLSLALKARQVVNKAEDIVDSVETVADVFRDTKGKVPLFKLIRNIVRMSSKKHHGR